MLTPPIGVICRGRNSYDHPSESALGLLSGHKPDSPKQDAGGRKGPEKSEQKLCCHHGRKHPQGISRWLLHKTTKVHADLQ